MKGFFLVSLLFITNFSHAMMTIHSNMSDSDIFNLAAGIKDGDRFNVQDALEPIKSIKKLQDHAIPSKDVDAVIELYQGLQIFAQLGDCSMLKKGVDGLVKRYPWMDGLSTIILADSILYNYVPREEAAKS